MSIAHLFTQAVICVNLWIQLFNLSIIERILPQIENQVEPSLSLKPSPLLLLQIAASLQTHDQVYWRGWSNILKRLIKFIEEVDQIYWRYWSVGQIYWRGGSNIRKRLIKYTEEVDQMYWISTKVVADCSSMPPNTWSSILDQVCYILSSRLF